MKKYEKLLGETLEVQSKTGNEKLMKKFVKQYLTSIGLKPKSDNSGNIICHKGDMRKGRPFIVAHLDTVHKVNKNVKSFFNGEFYYAFDMKTMEQVGIGGDDKVGVWSALAAMKHFDNISAIFFVQEEIGCIGSNAIDLKHFKKANWMVQLDRRGNIDFITSTMASDEFLKDMEPLAIEYGFVNTNQSTVTDVSTLFRRRVGVSAVNIASGYFFPHSDKEVVRFSDAYIALMLAFDMITKYGNTKYSHLPFVPKKKEKTKVQGFTGGPSQRSTTSAWQNAQYVNGFIRVWNSFYGCWEWRDYSGNLKYYEGIDKKARCYSRSAERLMSKEIDAPLDQEPIPMRSMSKFSIDSAKVVDERPATPSDDDQANIDFYTAEEEYATASVSEQIRLDEYWAKKAAQAERRDVVQQAEDEAAALAALDSGVGYPQRERQDEVTNYHMFEETRGSGAGSMSIAERSQARGQLDSALYLYGYSYQEFIDGLIPDDHIKNISSTLHYDHGNTVAYYERMFGIDGSYDSADAHGNFTDFTKKEGDLPF